MINMKELIGSRYGRLTIVKDLGIFVKDGTNSKRHYVECCCDCGNEVMVDLYKLRSGHTQSCGCIAIEGTIERNKKFKWGRNKKRYNEYFIVGDVTYVRYGDSDDCFIIDTEDLDKIKNYYWYKDKCGYAIAQHDGRVLLVHKIIMESPDGYDVDHINGHGSKWDNRKCNLRICSHMQNSWNHKLSVKNTSGYNGVSWNNILGKWHAYINYNNNRINIGYFENIEDAIEARKQAEIKYYGEYSREYGHLAV